MSSHLPSEYFLVRLSIWCFLPINLFELNLLPLNQRSGFTSEVSRQIRRYFELSVVTSVTSLSFQSILPCKAEAKVNSTKLIPNSTSELMTQDNYEVNIRRSTVWLRCDVIHVNRATGICDKRTRKVSSAPATSLMTSPLAVRSTHSHRSP
ncbi:hypothetical protein SCHPADRAFT_138661 [Schizopora paradoxa]|uniref:Uncharacterized protein n=1 Tax=Schizopora paradoxa TaxID=27342 RepID=A0A0H2S8G5_9AGAM|nr:hypothetical protein SCHPADRAFT_138661 [Schizopora paradoxa]